MAHSDNVPHLHIDIGKIEAKVVVPSERNGRRHDVTIQVERWEEATWQKALEIVSSEASFMAAMLNGKLPFTLQKALYDASINLNVKAEEWQSSCQCEQHQCMHIEQVWLAFYKVTYDDPIQLFLVKGASEQELMQRIRMMRSTHTTERMKPIDDAAFRPIEQSDEHDSPKRTLYFDHPDFWAKQVSLYSVLQPLYKQVGSKAQRILNDIVSIKEVE